MEFFIFIIDIIVFTFVEYWYILLFLGLLGNFYWEYTRKIRPYGFGFIEYMKALIYKTRKNSSYCEKPNKIEDYSFYLSYSIVFNKDASKSENQYQREIQQYISKLANDDNNAVVSVGPNRAHLRHYNLEQSKYDHYVRGYELIYDSIINVYFLKNNKTVDPKKVFSYIKLKYMGDIEYCEFYVDELFSDILLVSGNKELCF